MSQHPSVAMILRDVPCQEDLPQVPPKGAFAAAIDLTTAAHLTGHALRCDIANRALSYYEGQGWDSRSLVGALRAAFRHACEHVQLRLLDETLTLAIAGKRHFRHALYAFYNLAGERTLQNQLSAEHLVTFATALDELVLLRPRPTSRAWRSLEQGVKTLISEGTTPAELDVYLRLVVTDAQAFPQDAQIDFDLFGELTSAFRELRSSRSTVDDLQRIAEAIDEQRKAGQSALGVIRAFAEIAFAHGYSASAGQLSLVAQYASALARYTAQTLPADLAPFRRLLERLIQTVRNSEVVPVFAAGACIFAREGRQRDLPKLQALCERVHDWSARPQLLKNIVRAVDDAAISSSQEFVRQLQCVGAHGALECLRIASQPMANFAATAAFQEFTGENLGELAAVVRSEQVLAEWRRVAAQRDRFVLDDIRPLKRRYAVDSHDELKSPLEVNSDDLRTTYRLHDKFFGFSALRYAAQRTPTRGAAELARFGNDVGRVSYLNARDVTGFPGRGFFIRELKLRKIFATSTTSVATKQDPYEIYRRAWPSLAAEFDDLEQAEFLLTRGMIVISCRTPTKYLLGFPDGTQQQMSLAIFNDHLRNTLSCEACLIPAALLRSRLGRCFVGFDDFTGFQPQRPDANLTIGGIRELLSDEWLGKYVISVGGPERLRIGFPQLQEMAPLQVDEAMWARFTASVQAFNVRLRTWERRGHMYHASSNGIRENRALTKASADLAHHAVDLARDDRDRFFRVVARIREAERPVWQLTEQHLNLFDLLLISLAAWHKGYTQGEIVSRDDESQGDDFDPAPPLGKAENLIIGHDQEVFWNQNSIRMLALAYEWHSQRRRGVLDRKQYPILTVTDTLRLGSVDEPKCWLDTFDMVVHLNDNQIQLSHNAMSIDDEQFWHTQFMPQVADVPGKLVDLRFYPRESLGLDGDGV